MAGLPIAHGESPGHGSDIFNHPSTSRGGSSGVYTGSPSGVNPATASNPGNPNGVSRPPAPGSPASGISPSGPSGPRPVDLPRPLPGPSSPGGGRVPFRGESAPSSLPKESRNALGKVNAGGGEKGLKVAKGKVRARRVESRSSRAAHAAMRAAQKARSNRNGL